MSFRRIGFRRVLLVSSVIIIILGLLLIIKVLPSQLSRPKQTQNNSNSPSSISDEKTYSVKKVIDGDTIELDDGTRVRYLGIDAPEIAHDQELNGGGDECYGQEAKKINEDLVLRKKVRLEFPANKFDRYGRTLAWVYLEPFLNLTPSVNLRVAEQGAAFYYWSPIPVNYTTDLIGAQEQARKEKVGLWGKCGKINGECSIKGNLDRNDRRYYHLPGFKYYEVTDVNLSRGDRWFCSEEAAQKAGFKRAIE